MELGEKIALVTGGSEGIGRAIAQALSNEGCKVTITGRRQEALQQTAEELGVHWIAGDVGNEEDAVRTVGSASTFWSTTPASGFSSHWSS